MKGFIEKLIERLEEEKESNPCRNTQCKECKYTNECWEGEKCYKVGVDNIVSIVNQLAEEYKDTNVSTIDAGELLGNWWIPVSSGKLPDDGVPVEVTVKEDNDNGGYDLYVFESWYQDGQWVISKNRYNPMVTAWKPKDAPYQPKGE